MPILSPDRHLQWVTKEMRREVEMKIKDINKDNYKNNRYCSWCLIEQATKSITNEEGHFHTCDKCHNKLFKKA